MFRGSFVTCHMAYKAMMAKNRCSTDGARPIYISDGPLEFHCACWLPLMGRLADLNLFIPRIPPLPAFEELMHLQLHMSALHPHSRTYIHHVFLDLIAPLWQCLLADKMFHGTWKFFA